MFSERLENLIKAALQDGVLTEQEKASIIKRAQAEGEDIDEVDIYIQSLVQKKQQELAKEAQEAETTRIVAQKKEREARMASELEEQKQRDSIMRKCPVCGERIPALSNVCPHCQHVINSYDTDEKMMEMMKKITAASERMDVNSKGEIYLKKDENEITKDEYDRLVKEWKNKPNIRFSSITWGKNNISYYWYESFDYYFPLLAELEKLYGDIPKVQEFLLEQKRKRLNLLSNNFIKTIDGNSDDVKRAELTLNTIINTYGSTPEAQALIPDYQKRLKGKSRSKTISKTISKMGCLLSIVLLCLSICLDLINTDYDGISAALLWIAFIIGGALGIKFIKEFFGG